MRAAGRVAAELLRAVGEAVRPGVSTADLNERTRELMARAGARSASYRYGSKKNPYPGYACFSLNDIIVHGIPSPEVILREGDILSVDLAVFYQNFCGDNTATFRVGTVPPEADRLIRTAEEALQAGIRQARVGNRVRDIAAAIEAVAQRAHCGIVKEFVGHGTGHQMHESPQVPNYTSPATADLDTELREGMALAIEPMFTLGSATIQRDPDGWTVRTQDHALAAHAEHTVLVRENYPEVLTLP